MNHSIPVAIVRSELNGVQQFRAWSPLHYHFIENNDTALHPMFNNDYHHFMERLHEHLQQGIDVYGQTLEIHTDFHSHVSLENRGDTAYISIIGSHLSSPVFFQPDPINYYILRQRELHQNHIQIANRLQHYNMPHAFI
jgi:hypothetical protein